MDAAAFEPGDPADPRNWTPLRKWIIMAALLPLDMSVNWAASGFSPASEDFIYEFEVPSSTAVLGLSLYVLGLALGPLVLAPLSEYVGRSPVYVGTYGAFLCLLLASAVAETPDGFLALRVLSGLCAAATVANVGGTIADLWPPDETGPAMSLYLWGATAGSPSGYLLFALVARARGVRCVFWALLGICLAFWLLLLLALRETRHPALLRRRARRQLARRGVQSVLRAADLRALEARRGFGDFARTALTRPLRFLFSEAVVAATAVFLGYLFGLSFLFNQAFTMVFGLARGFGVVGVGTAFLGVVGGVSLGPVTNVWQERRYRRRVETMRGANLPEARVELGKAAGLLLPLSLYAFAWTAAPPAHFLLPVAAACAFGWAFYTLTLMMSTYLVDSFGPSAASALAGVGLVRHLAGSGFPLVAARLFQTCGYAWGGSWLALAACALAPVPFALEAYGADLRRWSPYVRRYLAQSTKTPLRGEWDADRIPIIMIDGERRMSGGRDSCREKAPPMEKVVEEPTPIVMIDAERNERRPSGRSRRNTTY